MNIAVSDAPCQECGIDNTDHVRLLDLYAKECVEPARLREALRLADAHVGWGDCTLEDVHRIIRAALNK